MKEERMKLRRLTLSGYKSIDSEGQYIEFGDVTVLLGANGAGKSNLVSFFKLLNYLTTGALQTFVGEQGYADSLLHYGAAITPRLSAEIIFDVPGWGQDIYSFNLAHASGDTLIFTEEAIRWTKEHGGRTKKVLLGAGHNESRLYDASQKGGQASRLVHGLLRSCQVFQFHDTSSTAKIRNQGYVGDNEYLRSNAGNLAAFLYVMSRKPEWERYYQRIVRHIQVVMPQFGDFILKPSPANEEYIRLDWREKGNDYRFGPHQLSDGSLRFMALTTLLMQPAATLPKVIVIDEPELGLHPAAVSALAGMIRSASVNCQIVLATQSPRLVDEFKVDEIVVINRDLRNNRSLFGRLDEKALAEWLQRYNLSDLWEKNVIGGRP